ncbi:KAP family NTPase [Veillonella atypica]|uniref:KAP family P-loop NTPase fold protein n=1 Tax=Veillonella atypica TaxID=39777 RepID=UPI001D08E19A|nr:P-loop NTPase fold protein [Veillonella atypica]MCB6770916.1 KAP family NTPase [Veillonella atypica]
MAVKFNRGKIMDYNSDRPIESANQDLLGRSTFSKQLAEAIYKYSGRDGLVIGLFGKWGTGKTSILNIVVNEINSLSEDSCDKPIIVKFSPWNYTDKNNLISLFFRVLKNKLEIDKGEEKRKKIGKALTDYSDALDALSLVPMVGSGLAILLKTIAKAQGAELSKEVDLDVTRNHLEEVLSETHQKIIVIIDDIDRLTNSQIRDIFQLVKQVGNFPNIIYVLSMDRNVVCRALEEVHNIDGSEYLEKIVQIPFEIPALMKPKIREIFLAKLNDTIKDLFDDITWDENYFGAVFNNCIEPYIKTLRDVNRVINTFQFRYRLLYKETAFEDMLALTTIEVLDPQLYQWIGNNKDLLCSTSIHSLQSLYRDKKDYRIKICNELERLCINVDEAIKFLTTLFPVFEDDIDERNVRCISSNIREAMRVAQEDRFNTYFVFDLSSIAIPRHIINNCIYTLDLNTLMVMITKFNDEGNIEYFIDELRSLVNTIPSERLGLLATAILKRQYEFKDANLASFYVLSVFSKAEFLVYDIFSKINNEIDRYIIIKDTVENVTKNELGVIASFINRLELSYGRLAGNEEYKDQQLITLMHLEELEKTYISKINEITQSEFIIDINHFHMAFYLWECLDKNRAQIYLKETLKGDINILKFVCSIASRWNGTDGSGWSSKLNNYLTYISPDTVYKKIQEFDKRDLYKFTLDDQIKLASFVLNYEKSDNSHGVNEKLAKELVTKWNNS